MDWLQVAVNSPPDIKIKNPPKVVIHLLADAVISLTGWACLRSRSPGWLFACTVMREGVILKLPAPRMNTDVCVSLRHPALHQSSAAIDVRNGSTMGKTQK